MKRETQKRVLMIMGFLVGILFLNFVLATTPVWVGSDVNYSINEDTPYYHNLSNNITGFANDITFAIDTEGTINWTNASGMFEVTADEVSAWISILDASLGNLSINATHNNQTGFFVVPIQAINITDEEGSITNFEFVINATNDAPNFTNINVTYNLTQDENFFGYLNASDEEEHYPLNFSIAFIPNCTHANWTNRVAGENCSLFDFDFNLINVSNVSASMNFTPGVNEVGTYWANITVTDLGNSSDYGCPHAYCDNSTYNLNKSYTQLVEFNVLSSLSINASNCQNVTLNESREFTCQINITTKGSADDLNISTLAILRNYDEGYISNVSWFYANETASSSGFLKTIDINITPQKTEIGNWTINFTVFDDTYGENVTEQIYVYVERNVSLNNVSDLETINDLNTSINFETTINLTVYDEDLKIPDKNETGGGYNETINFTVQIFNSSNFSDVEILNGFDVEILYMPVVENDVLTNTTTAQIVFTPNASEPGNYTINLTVTDGDNATDNQMFNITILDNSFPVWNLTTTNFSLTEDTAFYLNLSKNVSDPDNNPLTFSFTNDTAFQTFNLSTTNGTIDFTPIDEDVGKHEINITISDGYLTNTSVFNFTVFNINDLPTINRIEDNNVSGTISDTGEVNVTEDDEVELFLYIQDNDLKIPAAQILNGFYNESFDLNLTIVNSTGDSVDLFSFTEVSWGTVGEVRFDASFTPVKVDLDTYTITVNITDQNSASDEWVFNMTILETFHAPTMTTPTNQTSAVNRSFYYDINVTDQEDGNDTSAITNTNFTYSYAFLSGTDFINNNGTIFNTTTGIFNITFNDTQAGSYHLNITVNDTNSSETSDNFWLFVYNPPVIMSPFFGENFTLQENVTTAFNFSANHSVADNLTFMIYFNDVLRNTTDYYGNNTNFTWQFTPNFTDETYGVYQNLTLLVYPANLNLTNRTSLNDSEDYNTNITHTNFPLTAVGSIPSQEGGSPITLTLSDYFTDIDAADVMYNQTIDFSSNLISASGQTISIAIVDWVNTTTPSITFSATATGSAIYNLTVIEYNVSNSSQALTTLTSNNFEVNLSVTVPPPVVVTSSSTRKVPISLKIIVPDPISAYKQDRIVLPITLQNDGEIDLEGINLSSLIVKDNEINNDIQISFDQSYFDFLDGGEEENVTMTIIVDTDKVGTFEITINASVEDPDYVDWAKLYLTIKEGPTIEEIIVFTEEFIAENPECIELHELVEEARKYFETGYSDLARQKAEEAIDACKNAISQPGRLRIRDIVENKLYRYLIIVTLVIFFVGMAYYSYRRMRLKKAAIKKGVLKPPEKANAKPFVWIGAVLGILVLYLLTKDSNMTGFVIGGSSNNVGGLSLIFVFIIGFLAFLIMLNKKKITKKVETVKEKVKKKHPKNSVKGLNKKRIYLESGDYVGIIKGVVLKNNKINSLKIKLGKRIKKEKNIKIKGIILKYKKIKDVGQIGLIKGDLNITKRNV